jgi:peptidoglycan/LPS O-acetylase OafA/YrhL
VSYSIFIVHPFYLMVNFPELVLRKVGTQTEYFKTLEALPDWYLPVLFVPGIFAWAAVTFLLIEKPALVAGSRWMERRQTHEEPPRATPDAVVARSGS